MTGDVDQADLHRSDPVVRRTSTSVVHRGVLDVNAVSVATRHDVGVSAKRLVVDATEACCRGADESGDRQAAASAIDFFLVFVILGVPFFEASPLDARQSVHRHLSRKA